MDQWHYFFAGLRVNSHFELPEWNGFECAGAPEQADVNFRLDPATGGVPEPVVRTGEYCFLVPDIGTFQVRQGREIYVWPAAGAPWREVRLFLLGSAWGALCYQRGLLVLHASAVRAGEGAVAFCGRPGTGKSTLAVWLTEAGHELVSDDLVHIGIQSPGGPVVYASAPRLKLWRDAVDALAWDPSSLDRDRFRPAKFHVCLDGNRSGPLLPLRAVYLLEWGEPALLRLTGQHALRRLISAATYRRALLEPMGELGPYWRHCLELARRVPVWELARRRGLGGMGDIVRSLQDHWKEEIG